MERKLIYFYCRRDREDFDLVATQKYKNSVVGTVWFAPCPKCGRELIRLLGDKANLDPYFRLSRRVHADRVKYANDLLQPGDPGFDLLYPNFKKQQNEQLSTHNHPHGILG